MRNIGGLFGRSAWGPLWEHLEKAKECVSLLGTSIDKFIDGDMDKLQELADKVAKYEKEADVIKENIRLRLSRSIFSSVERSEIMSWLRQQDGIADGCEDTVKLLSLRKTNFVKEIEPSFKKLFERVEEMISELIKSVKIFGEMDVSEVTKEQIHEINKLIDDVQNGKDEVDSLQMDFLRKLFRVEEKLDPVSLFFLKDVADKIARIADRIENVSDIVRHMVTK
jgi:predicted phosphate transport protein (TIGR00153 family)